MLVNVWRKQNEYFQSYLNLNKPAVSFEVNQVRVSSFKKRRFSNIKISLNT